MSRSIKAALLLLIGATLVTATVFFGQGTAHFEQAHIFAGIRTHEFDAVMLDEGEVRTLHHTFELRNVSGNPVAVRRVWSTCGCTVASVDRDRVRPGETLEIRTALDLAGSGRRVESVFVELVDAPPTELVLGGVAQRQGDLRIVPARVLLDRERQDAVTLHFQDFTGDSPPPDPLLSAPEGIEAVIEEWSLVRSRDHVLGQPARWQCRIWLRASVEAGATSIAVTVGKRTVQAEVVVGFAGV